jgi:flagellar biosynthesis GTPase FlhF
VDLAMFSKNHTNQGVITVFLSDAAAGQTSSWYKIGALKKGSLLVHYGHPETEIKSLTGQMFNLDIHQVNSLSEIVSSCRKAVDEKRDVFVDFRNKNTDIDETKNFIEGLKRGFSQVEVLVCLSAIHSELYNRKVLKKFGRLTNGMVVNHLDLCLNFGMIINLSSEFAHLPYKFFGTGAVVPDDIESATKERILGGLFNL